MFSVIMGSTSGQWLMMPWALMLDSVLHTSDTSLIFRELPELSHDILPIIYHFLPIYWKLPHLNEELLHIFYIFFIISLNERIIWNLPHVWFCVTNGSAKGHGLVLPWAIMLDSSLCYQGQHCWTFFSDTMGINAGQCLMISSILNKV